MIISCHDIEQANAMMTLEQLHIFVAVAEREHLTRAAEAIGLTPSAVSSAIKNLEGFYGVALFNRVGRRIELTETGRLFLDEAKATLARARAAELTLAELGGMQRGELNVYASQTIASYWLPPFLMKFHDQYPGIEIHLTIGNTKTVSDAVRGGAADIGFIEGDIDEPALAKREVAEDALVIVVGPKHPWADGRPLDPQALVTQSNWILREAGSGTRSEFESALRDLGVDPTRLKTALVLPSNEAIITAVESGSGATAVSQFAVSSLIAQGRLARAGFHIPPRKFMVLRHKERKQTQSSLALEKLCLASTN
ncbi:LysR substrate-binding domain-containing protein [Thalassospira sp. GB04J01]|uniref:LysR substrate-binding domain-containing protein n=1 Tax=Thalassospira sp. GB04J01 TaxID=1485225 RepID=UPI003263402A|tara:strand:+ start:21046 stop:21978 length:933 start_codon:yes stop_codon:yes gene_type:complete